jgi:hypothetical protein
LSHIVTITTEVRDPAAIAAACRRLGLPAPVHGTARLFEGEATGLLVTSPGWLYPCVCNPATGAPRHDNYQQAWGQQEHPDRFPQASALEKARLEARKRGHSVVEQALPDGSVKRTIQLGGGS